MCVTALMPDGVMEMSEYRPLRDLTAAELQARYEAALADKKSAWAAWEVVRDAGQTDLHCAEWQAVSGANRALDSIVSEQGLREFDRKLALGVPRWETDPELQRAWIEGAGSEAR